MSFLRAKSIAARLVSRISETFRNPKFLAWTKRVGIVAGMLSVAFVAGCYFLIFVRPTNAGRSMENLLQVPDQLQGEFDDGRLKFVLRVDEADRVFRPPAATKTAGVNGSYLGPTIRVHRGDLVDITVQNQLTEQTTMHWHGMRVPAEMDGTPHQVINPQTEWTASSEVDQQAATMWYHPHPHGETGRQSNLGIAGLLFIDDENSERLPLPNTYGVDDIPLVIQDREFDSNGEFRYRLQQGASYGNDILVNGTLNPYLNVESRLIRFRLLNGSNARIYHIGFDDDREFHQIATDGGFLETPFATRRVVLAPGERAEILVDFADGSEVTMMSLPEAALLQTVESFFDGAGSGHFQILRVEPLPTKTASHSIPDSLNTISRLREEDARLTRTMTLGGQPAQGIRGQGTRGPGARGSGARGFNAAPLINGKWMEMHRVDEVVTLGDTEIWDVQNNTGQPHPFHVHLVQFQLLDRDGVAPSGADLGWKDTLLVQPGERARIIMKFERYADPKTPYMYHCHIMEHEDRGMMGQFLVVRQPERLAAIQDGPTVLVFIVGFACEHCFQQVLLFDRELAKVGINLVVVTPDIAPDAELYDAFSATVIADPQGNWSGWLGRIHEGPAHGTFVLDATGDIVWSDESGTPYMDAAAIIQRVRSLPKR